MSMFTQNEILLMIGVVSILLISIIILTFFDIKEYLKEKKNGFIVKDKEEIIKPIEVVETEEAKVDDIGIINANKEIIPSANKDDDIFIEEDEIIEPTIVNEIKEEPLSVQVNEPKTENINLEEEFNKALEEEVNEEDVISKFEEEQERTAIISLDELMKKSDELYNSNEYIQYDDGNEPITIDEVIAKFNKKEETKEVSVPEIMEDIVEEKKIPYSKKETIPFISSVYGLEKNNQLEFENTATYEKLNREKNNDFLTRLREEMNENK